MGLDIYGARFLLGGKSKGSVLGRTLTLGRQGIYMNENSYASFLKMLGVDNTVADYADDFFRGLGAAPLLHMDASDYEGAAIIHNMNEFVDSQYHSAFDTVIDGGTLEHVFNFPTAIRNCMEMVKPGGQLILMTPWHNYSGHGFYQFSPELIHNTLSEENGYSVEKMLIAAEGNWYSVKNPSDLHRRIEIFTRDPVLLYVTARRITACPMFSRWPQQSDYSAAWERGAYGDTNSNYSANFKNNLVNKIPFLQELQSKWRRLKSQRNLSPSRNPGLVKICRGQEIPL